MVRNAISAFLSLLTLPVKLVMLPFKIVSLVVSLVIYMVMFLLLGSVVYLFVL